MVPKKKIIIGTMFPITWKWKVYVQHVFFYSGCEDNCLSVSQLCLLIIEQAICLFQHVTSRTETTVRFRAVHSVLTKRVIYMTDPVRLTARIRLVKTVIQVILNNKRFRCFKIIRYLITEPLKTRLIDKQY